MKIRGLFKPVTIIIYFSLILVSGCAINKFLNIISGDLDKPKWDYVFSAPLVDMNLSPERLFDNLLDVDKYLSDVSIDAVFEKVDDSNYEELQILGFNKGDYFFKYQAPFSIPQGLFNSDIAKEIVDSLGAQTNEFQYSLDIFPIIPFTAQDLFVKPNIGWYRWPIEEKSMVFNVNKTEATFTSDPAINYGLFTDLSIVYPTYFSLDSNVDIPLDSFNLDINNDNISDINLKGVNLGADARIMLYISLLEGGAGLNRNGYLATNDVSFDFIEVEGTKYKFKYRGVDTDGALILESTNFQNSTFNFGGDINKDYKAINFEGLKFSVLGGQEVKFGPVPDKLSLNIKGSVNFGTDYSLVCDILPTTFNLGSTDLDMSDLTDFIDKDYTKANDYMKFLFAVASSLSFDNAALVLDVTNDLPLAIDLSTMFDDPALTTYSIGLNSSPSDTGTTPANGGFISYFDINSDSVFDKYMTLNLLNSNEMIIPASSDTVSGYKKIVITKTNSNLYQFLEQTDGNNINLKRPSKISLINTIGIAGQTDARVRIQQFSLADPIKLKGIIYLPVSLKVLKEKTDLGLQNIVNGMVVPITGKFLSQIPINDLDELSINISGTNNMPIGINVSFDLITSDNSKTIPLLKNGFIGVSLVKNGSAYVNSNGVIDINIEANRNLIYKDATGDEIIYDGDILDFFKEFAYDEQHCMNMNLSLAIVATKDENGLVQPVSFTTDSSFQVKANVNGKFKINLNDILP